MKIDIHAIELSIIDFIKKHTVFGICVLLFLLFSILYISTTPKVFQITSRVAIFRIKFEDPDHGSDDSRNRWIWVRDGLNINSALINDTEIKKLIDSNEIVKLYTEKLTDNFEKIRFIRSLISVTYTGGDESNYIIETKSSDARLSYEVNKYFFDYLKYLALQKDQEDFNTIILNLENSAKLFDKTSADFLVYKTKITKMRFEQTLYQTQKERAFQIISAPVYTKNKIWPRSQPIILFGLLLGVIIGFILEYILYVRSLVKND